MTVLQVAPPAGEPVTLDEAKAHLRLDGDDEAAAIAGLIAAARGLVEMETRRALIDQGWRLCLDRRPADGIVHLPRAPLVAVQGVVSYDAAGTPQTLSPASYQVDAASEPARIWLPDIALGRRFNGIEIDFRAGYGTDPADVPAPLRQAILMLVAHWFESREAAVAGVAVGPVALGVERLLAPFRLVRL